MSILDETSPSFNGDIVPPWDDELPPIEAYAEDLKRDDTVAATPRVTNDVTSRSPRVTNVVAIKTRGRPNRRPQRITKPKPMDDESPPIEAYAEDSERLANPLKTTRLYEVLEGGLWLPKPFRYDEFTRALELQKYSGVWERIVDENYQRIVRLCASEEHRLSVGKEAVSSAVKDLCYANRVDRLVGYLESLVWDKTERLNDFLPDVFGCPKDRYHMLVGRLFIQSLAARALIPGCQQDYVVILAGEQGEKKSKALRALMPQQEWFGDDLPYSLKGRDLVYSTQGKWLVEAAEMDAFTRAQMEMLKAFVTRRSDFVDLKYRTEAEEFHRRFVVVGTTNKYRMLKDPTGNRRFWPVVVKDIDLGWIEANRDQLFAEAVVRHESGEPWWPDDSDMDMLAEKQDEHYDVDKREDGLRKWIDARVSNVPPTISEILTEYCHMPIDKQDKRAQMEWTSILKHMDRKKRRANVDGKKVVVWGPK